MPFASELADFWCMLKQAQTVIGQSPDFWERGDFYDEEEIPHQTLHSLKILSELVPAYGAWQRSLGGGIAASTRIKRTSLGIAIGATSASAFYRAAHLETHGALETDVALETVAGMLQGVAGECKVPSREELFQQLSKMQDRFLDFHNEHGFANSSMEEKLDYARTHLSDGIRGVGHQVTAALLSPMDTSSAHALLIDQAERFELGVEYQKTSALILYTLDCASQILPSKHSRAN